MAGKRGDLTVKKTAKKLSNIETQKLLVDNLISFQKVMVELTEKFDKLSQNMSRLLELFESSAKAFAEKQGSGITKEDKDFLEKLDRLLEQNKVIARGLTLMEERIRDRTGANPQPQADISKLRNIPRF